MSGNEKTIAVHNYKADYQHKITTGQKANGELQLKELRTYGDEIEGLMDINLDEIKKWYSYCKKRHFKAVSPYEDGYEPSI